MVSGTFYKYPVASANQFGLYCEWAGEQNVAGNYTDITVTVYLSYWNIDVGAKTCTVSAGGSSTTFTSPRVYHYNNAWTKKLLGVATVRVPHESDGSKKNCTISVTFPFDGSMNGVSVPSIVASTTVDLDLIPRASVPTVSASSVYFGDGITIHMNRKSTAFTHKVTYTFGEMNGTIGTGIADSVSWYPDLSLAGQIPAKWSGTATIACTTYNGSTLVGTKYVSVTLMIPDNSSTKPSVSIFSVVPVSNLSSPFDSTYLQGLTKVLAEYSASAPYSDLSKVTLSLLADDGSVINTITGEDDFAESGIVTASGLITVRATAYNSRGQYNSDEVQILVEEYAPPSVNVSICDRCDDFGNPKKTGLQLLIDASRIYSGVDGKNTCELRYRIKKYDGTAFSSDAGWTSLVPDWDTSTDRYYGIVCGLDKKTSYSVEIGVRDSVGREGSIVKYVKTSLVALHLGRGGNRAAFGQYAEEDELLDVAWNQRVRKNLRVDGGLTIRDKELLDLIYPVGSIYMSVNGTAPGTLFGGTWERLKDRFLLAAGDSYSPGGTGGESSHTLTVDEMPSHSHAVTVNNGGAHSHTVGTKENQYHTSSAYKWTLVRPDGTSSDANGTIAGGGTHNHTASAGNSGGGKAHNNMPPYVAVYMWKRVS